MHNTPYMPVLAVLLAIVAVIAAAVGIGITFTARWSSPSGALRVTSINWRRTIVAKGTCALIAIFSGYCAGYLVGWWS